MNRTMTKPDQVTIPDVTVLPDTTSGNWDVWLGNRRTRKNELP